MDEKTHLLLSEKLFEICDMGNNAVIYSIIPFIDNKPDHLKRVYAHAIGNLSKLIENSISVLTNNGKGNKKSYEYERINEEKENLFRNLNDLTIKNNKISDDKREVALSILFHLYLDALFHPVHFFLPHSSHCSGKWDFWNEIDYINFIKNLM